MLLQSQKYENQFLNGCTSNDESVDLKYAYENGIVYGAKLKMIDADKNMHVEFKGESHIIPKEETTPYLNGDGSIAVNSFLNKVGSTIVCMVKQYEDCNILLSRKMAIEKAVREYEEYYHNNEEVSGRVSSLKEGGAFVELKCGVSSYLPINRICHFRISHSEQALHIGQEITGAIISFNMDKNRITLSITDSKKCFEQEVKDFEPGAVIEAEIVSSTEKGLIGQIAPNIVTLLNHTPGIKPGMTVPVKIRSIDYAKRQVKTKIIVDQPKREEYVFENPEGKVEMKPITPFAVIPGEKRHIDKQQAGLSQVVFDINNGVINQTHYALLDAINMFKYITSKQLYDLDSIKSIFYSQEEVAKALIKLKRKNVVICSSIFSETGNRASYKVWSLGRNGGALLMQQGKYAFYKATDELDDVTKIKKALAANQVVMEYMKQVPNYLVCEMLRVIKAPSLDHNTTLRVSARFLTEKYDLHFETVRQNSQWEEELEEKMCRYGSFISSYASSNIATDKIPLLIIIGESFEHNCRIAGILEDLEIKALFTEENLECLSDFNNSLYSIKRGEKVCGFQV